MIDRNFYYDYRIGQALQWFTSVIGVVCTDAWLSAGKYPFLVF